MRNAKSRRFARQIPESLIFSMVFAWSSVLGFSIAGKLRNHFPDVNRWILAGVGISAALLLLFAAFHWWLSRDAKNR